MDWRRLTGAVAMVTVAAHQSVASWLKCVFKPLFSFVIFYGSKTLTENKDRFFFVLWKSIISHQIINMPEGKKEHCKVRCLNQGRWSLFTCIHNYRKPALNPSKLKRFFICSDYRVKRGYGRDLRRAAPEEEGQQLKVEKRDQQITGSRRSASSENSWLIKSSRSAGPWGADRHKLQRPWPWPWPCWAPQEPLEKRASSSLHVRKSSASRWRRQKRADKEDVRRQELWELWEAVGWRAGEVSSRAAWTTRTGEAEAPRWRWDLSEAETPETSFSCS